jgi:hypothetical protein
MKKQVYTIGFALLAIVILRYFGRDTLFAIQFICGITCVLLGDYKKKGNLLRVGLILCGALSVYLLFDWILFKPVFDMLDTRLIWGTDLVLVCLVCWFFLRIPEKNVLLNVITVLRKLTGLRLLFTWIVFQIITVITMLREGVFTDYASTIYFIISLFNLPAVLSAEVFKLWKLTALIIDNKTVYLVYQSFATLVLYVIFPTLVCKICSKKSAKIVNTGENG